MITTSSMSVDDAAEHAASGPTDAGQGSGRGVPLSTLALFIAGCAVMVLAAANITHLTEWANRWGQIPVFLVFFLVMSIGGRWFWTGVDALIAAAREKD